MKHPETTSTLTRALAARTLPSRPRSHFAGMNMYAALITIAIPSDALRGRRCPKCPESQDHPRAAFQFVLLKISGGDASGQVTSNDDRKFPSIELAEYRDAKVGRARVWNVVIVAVLAGGFTVSAIGARSLYRSVQTQAKSSFETSASDVSAAVSSSLREDIDFVDTQRAGVVSNPDLTNRQLRIWYTSIGIEQRFHGAIGFAFVQRVTPQQLHSFGAEVIADPPVDETVTAPYAVFPPGQRSQYCLQRFGIATSPAARVIPTNFDFCSATIPPGRSPSPIPALLDEAAVTGKSTVLNAGTIAKTGGLEGVFVVFSPVYTSPTTPPSVADRQKELRGWIVGTFSGPALLRSSLVASDNLAVSVTFENPGSNGARIASIGRAPSGPSFTDGLSFNADGSWVVSVIGSARSTAMDQAVAVGVLGAAISALLFLLFVLLTRSRAMALQLVEKRTRQLEHQALYDSLTGLPNRSLIMDRAERMLTRATRQALLVGALFIDLDDFKEVNDTFGHQVGDEVLKAVGVRLSEVVRANDTVGRLGGDEFVVLAEGDAGSGGPETVATRLLDALSRPLALGGTDIGPFSIAASIGVAIGHREGAAELLRDADVALYQAKARGKHGYVLFDSRMHREFGEKIALDVGGSSR
jgi:diguanylate cyclase (GGDEF)-like protein